MNISAKESRTTNSCGERRSCDMECYLILSAPVLCQTDFFTGELMQILVSLVYNGSVSILIPSTVELLMDTILYWLSVQESDFHVISVAHLILHWYCWSDAYVTSHMVQSWSINGWLVGKIICTRLAPLFFLISFALLGSEKDSVVHLFSMGSVCNQSFRSQLLRS